MSAPLPLNEADRLRALRNYEILDTAPEVAFERITTLAARIFKTPIALISLVDANRQWFKACFGIDRRETSRDVSFCAHAILSDEVMVVPDATHDPRFEHNPLVTSLTHIRFYAGAPLKAPGGQNLGSLCVVDTVPREFTGEQKALLADLAAIVVDEMEMRRLARELRTSEAELKASEAHLKAREAELRASEAELKASLRENSQLATAVTHLKSGVIITDPKLPDNPIIFANPGFSIITGYPNEEIVGHNCRFLQGPDTDPAAVRKIREAIAARRSCQVHLLNYRKDGTPFVNELILNPVFDEAGELLSFVGVQNDVTEREQARLVLEQRVEKRTQELASSQIEILQRLAHAGELRDDNTGRHTQRVARTSFLLAQALGLSPEECRHIRQAAPLHDVGKIAISDLILLKRGRLTNEEFSIMQTHAAIGAALLSNGQSAIMRVAESIAGSHHERWNGEGYPLGLKEEKIPLEGRILAVADVFDALTHERPYKHARPVPEAVAEIKRQSGQQFDPKVVEAFLSLPHEELV